MVKAIGYCRVSTREQGLSRNGLEGQRKEILAFANYIGIEVVELLDEVASGSLGDDKRPVLAYAIAQAKAHGYALLVAKLDRFSRSVSYVSTSMVVFKRHDVTFYSAELGVDVDPFIMHLYASLAEKERLLIGQRTKAGLASKRARGEPLGNLTTLHIARERAGQVVAAQADAFAESIRPLMLSLQERKLTLRAMAEELNRYGTPTARGGKWTPNSVMNVLRRLQDSIA